MPTPAPQGWAYSPDGKALRRQFSFSTYLDGSEACRKVAELAEAMDHHPDLLLGYKRLEVTWSTHSQGGVTELDLQAARRVNELLA